MTDEAALVARAQAGDGEAFAALYEQYFDRIHDFLARMVRDPAEAADLTQDTFIKAMNGLPSLHEGASFKSWLFTIARNGALNRLERAARTRPLDRRDGDGEEYSFDVVDTDRLGSPEEAAESEELASLVWEAAAALEPRHYSVLHLTVREGLESAEIADVLGVTRNNAYVMVNRMKKALEDAVGALSLFRTGRRHCADLDSALAGLGVAEMSAEARRVIERHASRCETCDDRKRRMASPFAAFAALAPIQAEASVRETIFATVADAYDAQFGNEWDDAEDEDWEDDTRDDDTRDDGDWDEDDLDDDADAEGGRVADDDWWDATAVTRRRGLLGRPRALMLTAVTALVVLVSVPVVALAVRGGDEASPSQGVAATLPAGATASSTAAAITQPAVSPTSISTGGATSTSTPTPTPIAAQAGPSGPSLTAPGGTPAGPTGGGPPPVAAPPAPSGDASGDEEPDVSLPQPSGPAGPCAPGLAVAPAPLFFNGTTRSQTVTLTAEGCGDPVAYSAQPGSTWLSVSPASGRVPSGGSVTLTIVVDYGGTTGATGGRVRVTGAGVVLDIAVFVTRQPSTALPTPTPAITPQ